MNPIENTEVEALVEIFDKPIFNAKEYPVKRDGGFDVLCIGDDESEGVEIDFVIDEHTNFQDFKSKFKSIFCAIIDNVDVKVNFKGGEKTCWPYLSVFDKFYRCVVFDKYHNGNHSKYGPYCGLLHLQIDYEDEYIHENHQRVKGVMKGLENTTKGLVKVKKMFDPRIRQMIDAVENSFPIVFPFTGAEVSYKVGDSYNHVQPYLGFDVCMDGQVGFYRYSCAYSDLVSEEFGMKQFQPFVVSDEAREIVQDKQMEVLDVLDMASKLLKNNHYEGMKEWTLDSM